MPNTDMLDCLFVTYDFPPEGGVKTHRVVKFVKYLPEFGCRPVVFTTSRRLHLQPDPLLADEIPPETKVIRTPMLSPATLYLPVRDLWRHHALGSNGAPSASTSSVARTSRALRLAQRIFFPDMAVGWRAVAPFFLPDVLAECTPRVVWATSPPFSTLLVGRHLARKLDLPFVADMRDLYSDNPNYPPIPRFRGRARALEASVLEEAAAVVTVTQGMAEILQSRHSLKSDVTVIRNGFDFDPVEADFPATPPLRVGHIGSAIRGSGRDFDSFFEAWHILQQRHPGTAAKLDFTQIGTLDPLNQVAWDRLVSRLNVSDRARRLPSVSLRDVPRQFGKFNLLLLHNSPVPGAVPGQGALSTKTFEYLATNRMILALDRGSESADLIRRFKAGWVVPYDDPEAIAAALVEIDQRAEAGTLSRPISPDVMQFHRRNATAQLAELLKQHARVVSA